MNEWITDHTPPAETDVLIRCDRNGYVFVALGIYEDGTVGEDDSRWLWDNLENWSDDYDEEHKQHLIPESWWEVVQFSEDAYASNQIDCKITGWMPTPEV